MSARPPPPPPSRRLEGGTAGREPFDTFVSYRRADTAAARAVKRMAETFGARVFLEDEVVAMGGDWAAEIQAAAKAARTLFVLWSRNAAASRWIPVEVGLVDSQHCKIVPVLLDASPLPPFLSRYQGVQGLAPHAGALARLAELTQQRSPRLSHAQAVAQLVEELRADGVDLTPEQEASFTPLVACFGGNGWPAVALAFIAGHAWARAAILVAAGSGLGATALHLSHAFGDPPDPLRPDACVRIDSLARDTEVLTERVGICSAEVARSRSSEVSCAKRVEELAARPCPCVFDKSTLESLASLSKQLEAFRRAGGDANSRGSAADPSRQRAAALPPELTTRVAPEGN